MGRRLGKRCPIDTLRKIFRLHWGGKGTNLGHYQETQKSKRGTTPGDGYGTQEGRGGGREM